MPNLIFERSYYILDSYVDSDVLMAIPVKSNPKEFSFVGVNLTFLLVIIVLSILCLNVLIIGITVIICRWKIFVGSNYRVLNGTFLHKKTEKEERACVYSEPAL